MKTMQTDVVFCYGNVLKFLIEKCGVKVTVLKHYNYIQEKWTKNYINGCADQRRKAVFEGNNILGTNLKLQINSCYGATSINTSGNSLNSIYDVETELYDFERLHNIEKNMVIKNIKMKLIL